MAENLFDSMVHGGDYNPDQWINTPEIWDEDMRLMKLAHINSATVGIFSWSLLEPEEGVYNFEWLDKVMDKLAENGIGAVLATPSGARPVWLAEKYPEVLRVEESGIRNEFGVRHNHCLTSPVYRQKVNEINRIIADRYKNHPALKMWHISNEYSGECHCPLCVAAFRDWLKEYYHNDIEELNEAWWNGFWSHRLSSFDEISSPKFRGENHVPALKLAWRRFVSSQHISFYENEIAPLRELTPDVPITTNFMDFYDVIDYQDFASHIDIISWDNYPMWDKMNNFDLAMRRGMAHDAFRSMKGGKPFFMMESTPSIVNWHSVNKIPKPGRQTLSGVQAIAHGSDSVQYFQWRKSRGGHEKFHGAVVDHCGHENTRVFREVTETGKMLEKLGDVKGVGYKGRAAIVCDWQNKWAVEFFCGYNNEYRDYIRECTRYYAALNRRGIAVDVISMDDELDGYELVIAPFLYMLKDGAAERIAKYVENGGNYAVTFLTGNVDKNDLCFLGGFPGGGLRKIFGVWAEETDSVSAGMSGKASFNGKLYDTDYMLDIIHAEGAEVLGTYESNFYKGSPAVTVNSYGKGKAYYIAFGNNGSLADDFCDYAVKKAGIKPDSAVEAGEGCYIRKRGDFTFIMNFADGETKVKLDKDYINLENGEAINGEITLPECGYLILR